MTTVIDIERGSVANERASSDELVSAPEDRAPAQAAKIDRGPREHGGPGRVLMITYAFPPTAYVGVYRTLKYCKYLPAQGWIPIVLTANPARVAHRDPALLDQIPSEVVVHRTIDVDPGKLIDRVVQRKRRPKRKAVVAGGATGVPPPTTLIGLVKKAIVSLATASPDSHIFWVPFALIRGIRILLTERVDVIYCTTPPHSSHVIAFILAKLFRKPYVLDFRDPWLVATSFKRPSNKFGFLLKLETAAKQAIVRGAAKVIAVSEGERNELRAEFEDLDDDRFTSITNGYDPDDAPAASAPTPFPARSEKLSLIHSGTLYSGIADEFFDALGQLQRTDPDVAQAIQVDLLGEVAVDYRETIAELEAAGMVRYHGLRPHQRTLQMQQSSDVLVLLLGGTYYPSSHLPAKMFEYLHVGKPIFAVTAEGDLTDILHHSGLGIVVPRGSVDAVVAGLRNLVSAHKAGTLGRVPRQEFIRQFERRALSEQVVAVLNQVSDEHSRQSAGRL